MLCVANMAKSTFFYHIKSLALPDKCLEIKNVIESIYHKHKGRYGYRRITLAIRRLGYTVNHKRVQRLMKHMGLMSKIRVKRYKSYKGQLGRIARNVLCRDFSAEKPNQKWVTDVTEFNLRGDKLYLSPIMDLYNGEIVTYQLQDKPVYQMVQSMIIDAFNKLRDDEKPILHSDQGWQYQMHTYQQTLNNKGITQSMSRKGNCLDNAAIESFFGILKSECFHGQRFSSINELRKILVEYIHYYNHDRIKVKLNGLSPVEYRAQTTLLNL